MTRRIQAALTMLSAFFAVVLAAGDALASSWKLKSSEATEVSGAWHVYVSIDLNSPPALAHVPMKFLFTRTAVYERALVDGQKDPVTNRIVLSNQMPQQLSLDVDFADGTGKVFKGTRFDFGLTRTVGFEAGEYKVQLRSADGQEIGSPQNITLKGDNEVVDRRSITFSAKGGKDVKKVDDGVKRETPAKADDTVAAAPQNGDVAPVGNAAPFIPADAYNKTEEEEAVRERPKGCGCSVPGSAPGSLGWLAVPGLTGLVVARRRRRA